MPAQIPGRPPVQVKATGTTVYTKGRIAQHGPELCFPDVPTELRPRARELLRFLAPRPVLDGQITGDSGQPIRVDAATPAQRRSLQPDLVGVGRNASLLVLRPATPATRYDGPEEAAALDLMAAEMVARGCGQGGECCAAGTGCTAGNGPLAVYRQLDGVSTFAGMTICSDGFYRLHGETRDLDAPSHKMSACEWAFTLSAYDDAQTVVIDAKPDAYVHKNTAATEKALLLVNRVLEPAEDEGFATEALPDEVREGDTAILVVPQAACCAVEICQARIRFVEVLAVHHHNRSVVVHDTDKEFPYRVAGDVVLGAIRGDHWP